MCGILGVAGKDHSHVDGHRMRRALDAIARRGPDGEGLFSGPGVTFGHTRLSILELSELGRQPMSDDTTGVTLTYNGEIYNYLELRSELQQLGHQFRSHSDTEVLLRAYVEWGIDCLARLNGMFALGIFDPRSKRVFLARDRFGVKPLYYTIKNGSLGFASDPNSLIALGLAEPEPDPAAVAEFLMSGIYAAERTFYAGVFALPAAHFLVFDLDTGDQSAVRWWDYPRPSRSSKLDKCTAAAEFSALLEDAVRLRLRSDVPVGVSLSGGLDSTAILAATGVVAPRPPTCFTSTYTDSGLDELEWASKAATQADAQLVPCPAPSGAWLETLKLCVAQLAGPISAPAVIPLWDLMRQVRATGIKVLLDGQGADELFAGYVDYAAVALTSSSSFAASASNLPSTIRTFGIESTAYAIMMEIFPNSIKVLRSISGYYSTLTKYVRQTSPDNFSLRRDNGSGRTPVDARLWRHHSGIELSRLLHYADAISMAHGVESRMPFMDFRLVEWGFSVDEQLRVDPAQSKWMVREYLRSRGQTAIADRKDKKGYPTPFMQWLADGQALRLFKELPTDARIYDFVDRTAILKLLSKNTRRRKVGGNLIFRIVSLCIWLEQLSQAKGEAGQGPLPHRAPAPASTTRMHGRAPRLIKGS